MSRRWQVTHESCIVYFVRQRANKVYRKTRWVIDKEPWRRLISPAGRRIAFAFHPRDIVEVASMLALFVDPFAPSFHPLSKWDLVEFSSHTTNILGEEFRISHCVSFTVICKIRVLGILVMFIGCVLLDMAQNWWRRRQEILRSLFLNRRADRRRRQHTKWEKTRELKDSDYG